MAWAWVFALNFGTCRAGLLDDEVGGVLLDDAECKQALWRLDSYRSHDCLRDDDTLEKRAASSVTRPALPSGQRGTGVGAALFPGLRFEQP
jgi:hypothetical protein